MAARKSSKRNRWRCRRLLSLQNVRCYFSTQCTLCDKFGGSVFVRHNNHSGCRRSYTTRFIRILSKWFHPDWIFCVFSERWQVFFAMAKKGRRASRGPRMERPQTTKQRSITWFCLPQGKHMGVSKNSGTPKWMVEKGKALLKRMIWGYHHFWKPPYLNQLARSTIIELVYISKDWRVYTLHFTDFKAMSYQAWESLTVLKSSRGATVSVSTWNSGPMKINRASNLHTCYLRIESL